MSYTITDYTIYDEHEVLDLYAAVGWTNYTDRPEMLRAAFAGSLCVLGAYNDGRLIGLIRAVGDGASCLLVQDLLVHPDVQRQGIGTALLQELLSRYPAVYQNLLLTDSTEKTLRFYVSMGFTGVEDLGCTAFIKIG